MLLQGLFVPLTCPFDRDGQSYLHKLEHNLRRYSLGPAAGFVALPPNGEAAALTDTEAHAFLHTVAESSGKEKVLIAGIERGSVHAALELAAVAESAGFDAILLAPPPKWPKLIHGDDARELLLFYEVVADRSRLPVILWSDAGAPSLPLPLSVTVRLAKHPNVIGLADADLTSERLQDVLEGTGAVKRDVTVTTIFEAVTRRMLASDATPLQAGPGLVSVASLRAGGVPGAAVAAASPALKTRTRTIGFQVLSAGAAHGMLPLLQAGSVGMMPVLAAATPQGCFEAYAAWKDGDPALSAERGARLQPADELFAELGPAGVKYGCDWNGYFGGQPRLPRLALTADQRTAVEQALGEVRN